MVHSPSPPPGVPRIGSPDAVVARNRFLPILFSPPGLGNSAVWIVPTCCAALCPAVVTLTVPSCPMVTEVAFAGMVIAGSIGLPSAGPAAARGSGRDERLRALSGSPHRH